MRKLLEGVTQKIRTQNNSINDLLAEGACDTATAAERAGLGLPAAERLQVAIETLRRVGLDPDVIGARRLGYWVTEQQLEFALETQKRGLHELSIGSL